MKLNNLNFITKPFLLCFDINFKSSFGFTVTSKTILNYLELHNNINIVKKII